MSPGCRPGESIRWHRRFPCPGLPGRCDARRRGSTRGIHPSCVDRWRPGARRVAQHLHGRSRECSRGAGAAPGGSSRPSHRRRRTGARIHRAGSLSRAARRWGCARKAYSCTCSCSRRRSCPAGSGDRCRARATQAVCRWRSGSQRSGPWRCRSGGPSPRCVSDYREPVAERFQRRKRRRQCVVPAGLLRREALHDHAVGGVEDLQALRARCGLRGSRSGKHGFHQR